MRLLHAKLALLTFSTNGRDPPTSARLVVSTGNFTRASLKHQLELVFTADADLTAPDDELAHADLHAAATFVRDLAERHYQTVAERSGRPSLLEAFDRLCQELLQLGDGNTTSRFFHSLERSLFDQLRDRVEHQVRPGRNLLLCASGFVEQTIDEVDGPSVLAKLAELAPLTKNARRVLIVPPETTGQLCDWAQDCGRAGWERPLRASDPHDVQRRLHAKYVLLGRTTDDEYALKDAHIYFGSGNLSLRGMLAGPTARGNIECGVFFELPAGLSSNEVADRLFFSESSTPIEQDEWQLVDPALSAEPPVIDLCPILHARVDSQGRIVLVWSADARAPALISADATDWQEVTPDDTTPILLPSIRAVLHVSTIDHRHEWEVPVIDELGRYAWMREHLSSVRDLLAILEQQAEQAVDDDDETDELPPDPAGGTARFPAAATDVERKYDLLDMAKFVESVACMQECRGPDDLDDWLESLERLRDSSFEPKIFQSWPAGSVSLLQHLTHPAIAPRGMRAHQRKRYVRALETMMANWGLR